MSVVVTSGIAWLLVATTVDGVVAVDRAKLGIVGYAGRIGDLGCEVSVPLGGGAVAAAGRAAAAAAAGGGTGPVGRGRNSGSG